MQVFFTLLLGLDRDHAFEFRKKRCNHCGGPLHQAHFKRQGYGYGLPNCAPEETRIRFSFCCGADGCRKRMTPPSLRFLPYRAYLAITFVLVAAFHQGLTDERVARVRALYNVDRRTIKRWIEWWRDTFPKCEAWRALRGNILVEPGAIKNFPGLLLESFIEKGRDLQSTMVLMLTALTRPHCPTGFLGVVLSRKLHSATI